MATLYRPLAVANFRELPGGTGTVYYVQRADSLVKIGYTLVNLRSRLRHLTYEHGQLDLLALERGTFKIERARHDRFATLRVTGEWFRYRRPLIDHVRALRRAEA